MDELSYFSYFSRTDGRRENSGIEVGQCPPKNGCQLNIDFPNKTSKFKKKGGMRNP